MMLVDATIRMARMRALIALNCRPAVNDGGKKTGRDYLSAAVAHLPTINIALLQFDTIIFSSCAREFQAT